MYWTIDTILSISLYIHIILMLFIFTYRPPSIPEHALKHAKKGEYDKHPPCCWDLSMWSMTISKVKEPRIWRGPTIALETLLFSPPPVLSSHLFPFSRYRYSQPFCCFHPGEEFHRLLSCSPAFIVMDIVVDRNVKKTETSYLAVNTFIFSFDALPRCGKVHSLKWSKLCQDVSKSFRPCCHGRSPWQTCTKGNYVCVRLSTSALCFFTIITVVPLKTIEWQLEFTRWQLPGDH